MTHVKSARHRVLQPFHPLHQIAFRSLNEQVVVVGHQNPGMHTPAGLLASFGQTLQKESPVIVIKKNRFPPIASCHEVIVGTGKFNPETYRTLTRVTLLIDAEPVIMRRPADGVGCAAALKN
jgi:hypothetical protein